MTKNRAKYVLTLNATPEEYEFLEKFIKENGFTSKADFFRAAITAYIGKDIFRPRPHVPLLKVEEWNKKDKVESKKVKIYLSSLNPPKEPEPFDGWKFAGGEVVLNTDLQRIQIFFNEVPEREIIQMLKLNHFVWRPAVKAWQTVLRKSAVKKARELECLKPLEE